MEEEDESFQERQLNEKVCLSAIYMDDFRDESKDNDKRMDVTLHLMPQLGMSGNANIHVMVDMRVSCPPQYPSVLPEIRFENAKGLSDEKIQSLKSSIMAKARSLQGEEMILQLAQTVQQFLHSHNVPGMKSFFDEMQKKAEREREKDALIKQRQLEQKRKVEERERKELEAEMLRRQEAFQEESRQRREKTKDSNDSPRLGQQRQRHQPDPIDFVSSDNSNKSRGSTDLKQSPDASSDSSVRRRKESFTDLASDSQVVTVRLKTKTEEKIIHRGCLLDDQEGGQAYVGMDASNGHLCVIREWSMRWKHGKGRKPLPDEEKSASNCQKQLSSVEQELLTLIKLSHPNLVHYLAMASSQGKDSTTVQLMMEFVGSATLRHQIRSGRRMPLSILRQYAIDLLSALSYLHKKAVVHKQLSPGSVFLDVSGQLRLANYSICRRLNDLCESMNEAKHSVRFSEEKSFGARGGKKADVLKFGLILLGILKEDPDLQLPCEIPSDLPGDLQDFLQSCLDTDERNRASINILEEHPFVKHALPLDVSLTTADKKELIGDSPCRDDVEAEPCEVRLLSNSRLHLEFEVLGNIGKGGFGNVYKVRNRLDGNAYAIKRIILNPKSKELNRKITREVKLLSRLNHENVVRYFNSWIEVSEDVNSTESESDPSVSGKPEKKESPPATSFSLSATDNVEELAPRLSACNTTSSWSISASHAISDDDSTDSSDDEDVFGMSFMRHYVTSSSESDDGIEFEGCGGNDDEDESLKGKSSPPSTNGESSSTDVEASPTKYLYIQMEFCEKSTLRTSIEQEIYKDEKKLWNFFRQILEGLVHIHSQGMIHRDLKPDNIFLASNDLVKIGDFGLATSEQKAGEALSEMSQRSHSLVEYSQSQDDAKDFLTGKVGTALYVSPELCKARGGFYNQKVDLYSLGIIFFEMCNPPLATGMERVKMLGSLRQETIEMPDWFGERDHKDKRVIIKWLLNHDPTKRPTAKELLESPYFPPLEIEEARFQEMIKQTVSDDKSRGFKHLMGQLFSQTTNEMNDVLYDMDNYKGFSLKQTLIQRTVHESLTRLFEKHGAVRVTSPLLMPRNTTLNTESCTFMDSSGGLVMLPFDLRVPFARNVARNAITRLKRYAIQKVYRERKVNRCHPRELTECAFDIVTNITTSLLPDAEAIYIVSEIIEEFPALEEKKHYFIRINHSSLLKAILSHCSIPQEKHEDVMRVLRDAHIEMTPIETQLAGLSISEQEINSLVQFIGLECSLKELSTKLKPLTKGRGPHASMAKQALHELEAIISQAEIFGVRQKIMVTPNLVHKYYSGLVFQFVALFTRKGRKQVTQDKLAAGGRYDHLIPMMGIPSHTLNQTPPKAVGVSINFDKIVASLLHDEEAIIPVCDVLVCVMSSSYSIKYCIQVVRNLWNNNVKADILYDASMSLEDIQEYCKTFKVSHLVLLKDHSESGMVWVRSIDPHRVVDSRVASSNLVEVLQQRLSSDPPDRAEPVAPQRSQSFESFTFHNQTADFSVTLLSGDNHRLESNNYKKRIERQIQPRIMQVLEHLSSKVVVEVVAVDLPMEVVKNIVAILDLEGDESSFDASVQELCNKYSKYRKYIPTIADNIQTHKEKSVVVILYSYKEDGFKVFL